MYRRQRICNVVILIPLTLITLIASWAKQPIACAVPTFITDIVFVHGLFVM